MRIKAPVFINGFSRGGTNILLNLIASHPQVVLLNCETHELFYGRGRDSILIKAAKRALHSPILFAARQPLFKHSLLEERNRVPSFIFKYIDLMMSLNKMKAMPRDNPNYRDGLTGQFGSRLLCKNINGTVFLKDLFDQMYANAKFVGLIRNGLALCEGFIRRGWDAAEFGRLYRKVSEKMISDQASSENYRVIQFEKLISDPENTIKSLYDFLELDLPAIKKFRLQSKPSMGTDGKRAQTFGSTFKEIRWFTLDEIKSQFRTDVNENQIRRLKETDKELFLKQTENAMRFFGYIED